MLETVKCTPEEADIFTEVLSEKVVHLLFESSQNDLCSLIIIELCLM